MSHITRTKVEFRDRGAIEATVRELQALGVPCRLEGAGRPRVHGAERAPECEMVVRLPGSYDLGFQRQGDHYSAVLDSYGVTSRCGGVGRYLGAPGAGPSWHTDEAAEHQIGRFTQLYAKNVAVSAAMAQGYLVEEVTTDAQGHMHITLGGM